MAPWLAYSEEGATSKAQPDPAASSKAIGLDRPGVVADAAPAAMSSEEAPSSTAAVPTTAPAKWIVEGGGNLGFTATVNGASIKGHFARWTAEVVFDPVALKDSHIVVQVPLLTASTADNDRDQMLKGPDFFGSAAGPAVFRSSKIQKFSGEHYTASGTLTMNGESRPITLDFQLHIAEDTATVTGSSRLNRADFGIGTGSWTSTDQIAAEVAVSFHFKAHREK
jgi:polyisoprenoid-binding protein YceI